MDEHKLDMLANNEKEWRKHILKELFDIKKNQEVTTLKVNTLEVKMMLFGFLAGAVGNYIGKLIS